MLDFLLNVLDNWVYLVYVQKTFGCVCMSDDKEKRFCPKCGSEAEQTGKSYRAEQVSWSDGLGSPGHITFSRVHYACKKCNHCWDECG